MQRIVLALHGEPGIPERIAGCLNGQDHIVCADGGAQYLLDIGVVPHAVFGDFDSSSPELIRELEERGVTLHKFPQDKDQTDFELALDHCLERPERELIVLFPFGGRVDHFLTNLFCLIREVERGRTVILYDGRTWCKILYGPASTELAHDRGERLSLIPLSESVIGVTLTECKWPLDRATLLKGSGRTLSNVVPRTGASLSFERGCMMAIQSFEEEDTC